MGYVYYLWTEYREQFFWAHWVRQESLITNFIHNIKRIHNLWYAYNLTFEYTHAIHYEILHIFRKLKMLPFWKPCWPLNCFTKIIYACLNDRFGSIDVSQLIKSAQSFPCQEVRHCNDIDEFIGIRNLVCERNCNIVASNSSLTFWSWIKKSALNEKIFFIYSTDFCRNILGVFWRFFKFIS